MPETTPLRNIQYPVLGDAPAGPQQMEKLARDVDNALGPRSSYRQLTNIAESGFAHNTWTRVTQWSMTEDDFGTAAGITYGNGGFTFSRSGFVEISFALTFVGNSTGVRSQRIRRDTNPITAALRFASIGASVQLVTIPPLTWRGRVNAGDRVIMEGIQTSGGGLSLTPVPGANYAYAAYTAP